MFVLISERQIWAKRKFFTVVICCFLLFISFFPLLDFLVKQSLFSLIYYIRLSNRFLYIQVNYKSLFTCMLVIKILLSSYFVRENSTYGIDIPSKLICKTKIRKPDRVESYISQILVEDLNLLFQTT